MLIVALVIIMVKPAMSVKPYNPQLNPWFIKP